MWVYAGRRCDKRSSLSGLYFDGDYLMYHRGIRPFCPVSQSRQRRPSGVKVRICGPETDNHGDWGNSDKGVSN